MIAKAASRVAVSPLCWFGGKHVLAPKIIDLMPSHDRYIEVFGGGGSVLMAKNPVSVEVYNDIDDRLVNFFRVLQDPIKFDAFARRIQCVPYSRSEFNLAKTSMRSGSEIDRAVALYITCRQSFSGCGGSWGYIITKSVRGMSGTSSRWLSAIEHLPAIHARLMRVQIECNDWRKILDTYDGTDALFYLDPPYVPSTRKSGGYQCELKETDHVELVEKLLRLKCRAMLSGYPSEVYRPLENAGWSRLEWNTSCYSSSSGRTRTSGTLGKKNIESLKRVEVLWANFPLVSNLFADLLSQDV